LMSLGSAGAASKMASRAKFNMLLSDVFQRK
jgi:hypothetical protein